MLTRVGELLFNQTLDFAWCHLVLSAHDLGVALPLVQRSDLSVLAEIGLAHRERIKTRDVDWLAWEDPFVYSQDAAQLKAQRETDVQETLKRLSYVLPKLQLLAEAARRQSER